MSTKAWSIIIPALNEEKHLPLCLESLKMLSYDKNALEIVVADNGSTDRTATLARDYPMGIDKKVLILPDATIGGLRNAAADASSGRLLAFLDADCTVGRFWLTSAERFLSENPNCVIGAFYKVPDTAGWPARIWHRYFHAARSGEVSYIPASNLLLPRSLFQKIGGFHAGLQTNEDSQICAKARSAGSRIVALPELAITHWGAESSLCDFFRRQFWHGSSVLNRNALGANIRAIAIAIYTWICIGGILMQLLIGQNPAISIVAFALPSAMLTARGMVRSFQPKHIPALFVLLSVYSLARAMALPVAFIRGMRLELGKVSQPGISQES